MQKTVGAGSPHILQIDRAKRPPAVTLIQQAYHDEELISVLVNEAKKHRNLNLIAYQTTSDLWAFAKKLSEMSGATIHISGPPAYLSKLANNKLWFAEIVRELLGDSALPLTFKSNNAAHAATLIKDISRFSKKLIVKLPSSAGGLGNITLASSALRTKPLKYIQNIIQRELTNKGWQSGDPFLVSVWEDNVTKSPSVQLWIPHSYEGAPIIEGIFEQSLRSESGVFDGAQRAKLSPQTVAQICNDAMQLAILLQELGYYGRLSFDSVLISQPNTEPIVHWIEANARWGGVSIPLTIGQKLTQAQSPKSLFVFQRPNALISNSSHRFTPASNISALSSTQPNQGGIVQLLPDSGDMSSFALFDGTPNQVRKMRQNISALS
jgi:hypothetical protein